MRSVDLSPLMRLFLFISLILMLLVQPSRSSEPMMIVRDPSPLEISTSSGPAIFDLEIANTDVERASGLMFRTNFPENRAMLFDFQMARPVGMWMKNTPLPLDMMFVEDNGRIVYIFENTVPQSLSVVGSSTPVRYVLEINAGLVKSKNIRIGDVLRHPLIKN